MGRTRPLALFATLGSMTLVAACSSWQRTPIGAGGTPILSKDKNVRALLTSGNTIWLANAQVVGDSLVGDSGKPAYRLAVALNEVKKLEEQEKEKDSRSGLGIGCAAVLVVAALGVFIMLVGLVLEQA